MTSQDFSNISIRGRVAFLIVCLENALRHFKMDELQWAFILGSLWCYTNGNAGKWHEQLAECVPKGVLTDTDDLSDLQFLNETQFWDLNNLYRGANNVILRIVDVTYYVGIKDLYSSITNNSPATLAYMDEIISLMNQNHIPLPDIKLFKTFSINENGGWGVEFSRDEVFKHP